ncbi:DNA cytosine methyltransferase [Bordetella avium]|uniref:DNA cytosine methyltransferase n=1 Tax=Bordetella avium TaxID=521 RepID=UPI000E0C639A|nr:DNA cytosine methyltransferase [Bordetella avium]RIQ11922.1 DNA cytosine methyltransferase [Bordetella avium]RIQ47276.1 DNA cytosine methyltransferase [Bordetella avium]RIQ51275.1 DNA cytosine methyltransferase [Bordetella avium]RIQ59281.1 DNA cytosine methyltransferase [Bordetella avium]RIQ60434.1 DNA cytosine methyltransferase [Bordetella avium]
MAAPAAYYNEIDPYAAQWLRNLIAAGHIAPGDVDERSIEDVHPDDLRGYTQAHWFAGIGVWSLALRRAGWPDDRPVWTGSCPCQPFSAAGKGIAFDDERHLWPAFFHLIQECRPPVLFGEQVASKDADSWIDLVQADLEGVGYAVGAVPFPSASIGAPHIRDRLYWLANAAGQGLQGRELVGKRVRSQLAAAQRSGTAGGLAHADHDRRAAPSFDQGDDAKHHAQSCGEPGGMERPLHIGRQRRETAASGYHNDRKTSERSQGEHGLGVTGSHRLSQHQAGPVNGFWRASDWLLCRDGKWRPVEPGTSPLAHGAAARVGRLRAYGNAINAVQAQIFVEESMRCL